MCHSGGVSDSHVALDVVDTIILCALAEEAEAVFRALPEGAVYRWRGNDLFHGRIQGRRIVVIPIGAMGNASSAQAAQHAIAIWNPARILVVGIAAGARGAGDDLRLGDVLVPDQVVGYELGKVREQGLERRYEVYRPAVELLQIARSVRPEEWVSAIVVPRPDATAGREVPKAHFGGVFSGEKVLADSATLASLRLDWPKALGVEMEGFGIAITSYRDGPGFLLVKAVCDFADPVKDDSWHGYAAEAAARFAVAVLQRLPAPVDHQPRPQAVPKATRINYPGTVKLHVVQHLGSSWQDLADYFEIPSYDQARFRAGDQPRDLWNYLEIRTKLFALADALNYIKRSDLADILRSVP